MVSGASGLNLASAKSYYTWNNSKEVIEARTQAINGYLTKELQDLNIDTIRTDIPTSSTVTDVIVWSIKQSGMDTFSATYEVDQKFNDFFFMGRVLVDSSKILI